MTIVTCNGITTATKWVNQWLIFSSAPDNQFFRICFTFNSSVLKVVSVRLSLSLLIYYSLACRYKLSDYPEAQSGSNNNSLSPLVHHYSSCSSLEFRVLPFSLRLTLWRKSAARAHAVPDSQRARV